MTTDAELFPLQLCYVVEDVSAAVAVAEQLFGWGPFNLFTADVDEASYREWRGRKRTEVALDMAGAVQIEFIHVHEGEDAVATFQSDCETGLQHIGIHCKSRESAIVLLCDRGATVNELNEYPGIRFAFLDVPTGNGMFELLQPTEDWSESVVSGSQQASRGRHADTVLPVTRVSIVTEDIAASLAFYSAAFGWSGVQPVQETLLYEGGEYVLHRALGKAGLLDIELVQPSDEADCPYRQHLARSDYGLVHAGVCVEDYEQAVSGMEKAGFDTACS